MAKWGIADGPLGVAEASTRFLFNRKINRDIMITDFLVSCPRLAVQKSLLGIVLTIYTDNVIHEMTNQPRGKTKINFSGL
jgi:hypothetical protein